MFGEFTTLCMKGLNHATVELQIQKTQKILQMLLKTIWKFHFHGSASITKAKHPEMMQDQNASKVHPVIGNGTSLFDRFHEGYIIRN